MRDLELFSRALGLQEPWRVVETSFEAEQRRLDLRLDFEPGARFACALCERFGIEETSFRRGQDYVSLFAALERTRSVLATPRPAAASASRFVAPLPAP